MAMLDRVAAIHSDSVMPHGLGGLVPHQYQSEVFVRAQKANVIAALPTGSGKTLISVLLMRWIASQEQSKGKIVAFLVPKVTLVEQQWRYIQQKTSLRVAKLHGALDLDLSDRSGWKKRFETHDVFVMTAQIFLNILTHSLWKMDKVSLMIFDECHHARKNHPYNGILREYFQLDPSDKRPKIFGMTASPIWNVKNPLGSLSDLESNMNAKVIAVVEHVQELNEHSPKAKEIIKEYPLAPEEYNYSSPTIYQCLKVVDNSVWDDLEIPWRQIDNRYWVTFYNLGPYCASMFLFHEIQYYLERFLIENKQKILDDLSHSVEIEDVITSTSLPSKRIPDELHFIIDILQDFQAFFPGKITSSTSPIPVSNLAWCTPKLKVLVDILLEHHSPSFQGIIFVEQRHDAYTLSKVLNLLPELQGRIRSAFLVGQGVNADGVSTRTDSYEGDPIKLFRDHALNILIATSVAEEGLDFPECDLVVRFDPVQHMVGYLQSRGRARKQASTFIVMIPKGDTLQLERYQTLQQKEPEVARVYQTRHAVADEEDVDDDMDETDPVDLAARERYVVPSTGAVLSYDNSLSLLNHLCSLIPRDAFTPIHKPKYTGEFEQTLHLPRALPLSPQDLTFTGPLRRSKREAKRAAAFMAVKRLKELDVFDEYLLPLAKYADGEEEEVRSITGDGKLKRQIPPPIMSAHVRDPWYIGQTLWSHTILVENAAIASLITSTVLPPQDFVIEGSNVQMLPAALLEFDADQEHEQRLAMHQFTRCGVWYNNTSRPFSSPFSFYLVPITPDRLPDFEAIQCLLSYPEGNGDWSKISEEDYDKLMVICRPQFGSIHILRRIREDLTPLSTPLPGSREATSPTYHEYWTKKWSRKNRQVVLPTNGPVLETFRFQRSNIGTFLFDSSPSHSPIHIARDGRLLPQASCAWLPISHSIRRAFEVLPVLCHRITSGYRARCARYELNLPPSISTNFIIEAFTIPAASFPFSNQRMETLGDAVLQLCTTVHLLNRYPNRHEGQLTKLRQQVVSNRYLMYRALDLGLEQFLNSEIGNVSKWRYTSPDDALPYQHGTARLSRVVTREYPRRSLQDCMEALVGACFLAGGIPLALQGGTALGLEFGGPLPWFIRYHRIPVPTIIAPAFAALEENLNYKFRHNHLVMESLTHPSFTFSDVPSYQRLEFLGDAVLDLFVVKYLFDKFPSATSHQLAFPRTKAICNQTLAYLAVKKLSLHKMMLMNSMDLNIAVDRSVSVLDSLSADEIVKNGWKYDPPKALSDLFESVVGAVLVDSGYDYEKTAAVLEYVMEDVLEVLSPSLAKDPVSELMEWAASTGCTRIAIKPMVKKTELRERDGVAVLVHGKLVVGPIVSSSLNIARFAAAERALTKLRDPASEMNLANLCDCALAMSIDGCPPASPFVVDSTEPTGDISSTDDEDAEDIDEVAEFLIEDTTEDDQEKVAI
ncbi:hypothetical protein M413DRAFT_438720 [Hebeloma cylindrosporum]|uniref:Dicer-like protein 1 n=1 Tax=Hebeloma cylindrosporum TaxID=76867 RepID=A0A0C3D086_HEBCY|nr:hypothetical protein M413DRAFT_438720 [Hebeloma cylindrosporum h7]